MRRGLAYCAVRHSLFSDIFIPAKSRNICNSRENVCGVHILSPLSHVGSCIQFRHVAGALDLDCVFGAHLLLRSKLLTGGLRRRRTRTGVVAVWQSRESAWQSGMGCVAKWRGLCAKVAYQRGLSFFLTTGLLGDSHVGHDYMGHH